MSYFTGYFNYLIFCILGILPDSPPDSGSEHCHLSPHNEQFQLSPNNPDQHCQLSPHYSLSPPDLTTTGDVSITLYNDPVLYQDGPDTNIRNSGFYGRDRATYIPDISNVDYDQPLQIVESAQVISSMYPTGDNLIVEQTPAVRNQIMRHHAAPTVIGVNNNSVGSILYKEMAGAAQTSEIKQEPIGSPPANNNSSQPTKPIVNKRKKRGASESVDKISDVSSVKIKSEAHPETDQVLNFKPFQPTKWRETYNSEFQNLKTPALRVTADKGFNFSLADDAFIAQKKNHFQLSCHVTKDGEHALIATDLGYKKIEYFQLNFFGVKKEAPEQRIQVDFKTLNIDTIFKHFLDRLNKAKLTGQGKSSSLSSCISKQMNLLESLKEGSIFLRQHSTT